MRKNRSQLHPRLWLSASAALLACALSLITPQQPSPDSPDSPGSPSAPRTFAPNRSPSAFSDEPPPDIYVFGDSLSDLGNLARERILGTHWVTQKILEKMRYRQNYCRGRFTNGRVWHEYVAEWLSGNPPEVHAVAGAATRGARRLRNSFITSVRKQVARFHPRSGVPTQAHTTLNAPTYVFYWAGANNYLDMKGSLSEHHPRKKVEKTIEDIQKDLKELVLKFSTEQNPGQEIHFLIPNLPPMENTPRYLARSEAERELLAEAIRLHNESINALITRLNQELRSTPLSPGLASSAPRVQLHEADFHSVVREMLESPAELGFANATDCCQYSRGCPHPRPHSESSSKARTTHKHAPEGCSPLNPIFSPNVIPRIASRLWPEACEAPESYVFWDEVHPTTTTHCQLAFKVWDTLFETPKLTPEMLQARIDYCQKQTCDSKAATNPSTQPQ